MFIWLTLHFIYMQIWEVYECKVHIEKDQEPFNVTNHILSFLNTCNLNIISLCYGGSRVPTICLMRLDQMTVTVNLILYLKSVYWSLNICYSR